MRIKNIIAAICGIILIACMAAGLPVSAAETDDVVYVDIDGDGQISQAEIDYAQALKAMQDYHERLAAREAAGLSASEELLVPEDAAGNEELIAEVTEETSDNTVTTETEITTETVTETAADATIEAGTAVETVEVVEAATEEETAEDTEEETTSTWTGTRLTKLRGTVKGPSGRETYYNLNMSPVITLARQRGVEGSYWVRDDGCKMYGDYIIVAANYRVHPYGSIIETSLGTAKVLDTGGFASYAPRIIDIATNW